MQKVWKTALEVIGIGVAAIAVTLAIGLLAACTPRAKTYIPPTHITIIQPVRTIEGTGAVIVSKPIPGQVCWKQQYKWYCRPATSTDRP